ncbi:MAG: CPBP family intramembrane metalloprotease [Myxococcota bacterium]|nr:CPBP family intramembrane metalloprotease [Myxococcota bacterium]
MSRHGASAKGAAAQPPFFGASVEAKRARIEWLEHGLSVKDWSARLRELDPRLFFRRAWRVLDEVAADERAARDAAGKGYDYRPIIAMCVGAVCLTLMEYFGHATTFRDLLHWLAGEGGEESVWGSLRDSRWLALSDFVWWSGWRVLGYFVLPALVVKWWFKERLRDHGLETSGIRHHAWIYVLSYGAVFVGVMFVAKFVPHFTEYYPFYDFCSRSWFDLIAWELLYAAQFLSLEFFFRGFWMRSMRTSMGSHAIFAMVVPYCMIHFGKPFLEAMAAIFAGVVLGTLALRTRSIWGGCVVHIGVAITMDVTALIVSGRGLPVQWWPG